MWRVSRVIWATRWYVRRFGPRFGVWSIGIAVAIAVPVIAAALIDWSHGRSNRALTELGHVSGRIGADAATIHGWAGVGFDVAVCAYLFLCIPAFIAWYAAGSPTLPRTGFLSLAAIGSTLGLGAAFGSRVDAHGLWWSVELGWAAIALMVPIRWWTTGRPPQS